MKKSYPSEVDYSKDEIKSIISNLKNNQGWLKLPPKWADKDGGGGEYIQHDFFHVRVNPEKIGDLGDYELKTHRSATNSLVTLNSIDPKDKERGSLLHPLLVSYGYPYQGKLQCRKRRDGLQCKHVKYDYPDNLCYPRDEVALGIDICGKDVFDSPQNNWGFYLEVNRDKQRIFMHFDPSRTSTKQKYQDWLTTVEKRNNGLVDFDERYSLPFDEVETSCKEKFHKMVFLKYAEKKENGEKFIKVEKGYFLEEFSFEKFLEALDNGKVMYELRLHGNTQRISKNHGTGFRMFEKNFPAIYSKTEIID